MNTELQLQQLIKFLYKSLLFTMFSVALLPIFEIGLRLLAPQYNYIVMDDPDLGSIYRPNEPYKFFATENCPWSSEGNINSDGFRDNEEGDADFRIIALGNSYTAAFQFPVGMNWTEQLEMRLNSNSDAATYSVINAGVSASNTPHQYLMYQERAGQYPHDIVILLFFARDIRNNSPRTSGARMPFFSLEDEELVLDKGRLNRSLENEIFASLRTNFYTVQYARQASILLKNRLDPPATAPEALAARDEIPTAPQAELEAMVITQAVLLALHDKVEENGATFVLVHGSRDRQVNWETADNWGQFAINDLHRDSNLILQDFAEANDIQYIDLVPLLRDYSIERKTLIHGCEMNGGLGHWNENTQALVGQILYTYLVDNSLVPD